MAPPTHTTAHPPAAHDDPPVDLSDPILRIFRRTILADPPSAPQLSLASPHALANRANRLAFDLSHAAMSSYPGSSGFYTASSRQIPSLSHLATPAPRAASGSNRVPVISRRRSTSNVAGRGAVRPLSYEQPFPIPDYLRHSSYAHEFFTTKGPEALVGDGMQVDGAGGRNLSEGLRVGEMREGSILLPTCWDEDDKGSLISLSSDGLGMSFAGSAKYQDRDAAAVRTNRPIPTQCGVYYFEVAITDRGESGYIGIGVSHRSVSLSRLPGWEVNSWGYHGDDGRAFASRGTGESFGPTFTTGDVVGCGIDWTGVDEKGDKVDGAGLKAGRRDEKESERGKERREKREKEGGRVFFTKNGEMLGYAFSGVQGNLYPSVGLRTPGEVVRANFGAEPFKFDIDTLVLTRQRAILSHIASTPLTPSLLLPSPSPPIPALFPTSAFERSNETLQSLINAYLIHHGYTSTSSAFSSQCRTERIERALGLVPNASIDTTPAPEDTTPSSTLRTSIRRAFLAGEADKVLQLTQAHFPAVLLGGEEDESGGMLFKLRLRVFIEAVIRSGKMPSGGKGKGRVDDADIDMDDDASPSPSLDTLLSLGRSLHLDYSNDSRPSVQDSLAETFSLLAYEDPSKIGGKVGALLSREAREEGSDQLNSAILVSQALPPIPHLMSMYRQTEAQMKVLGDMGSGGAALIDVRKEMGLL